MSAPPSSEVLQRERWAWWQRALVGLVALMFAALALVPSWLWLWMTWSVQNCGEAGDVPEVLGGLAVVLGSTVVFGAIWVGVLALASLAIRARGLKRRTCVVLIAVLCVGSLGNMAVGVARGPMEEADGCDIYD